MKPKVIILASLLAVFVCKFSPLAGAEAPLTEKLPPVVSTTWLADHLNDADLITLHIGPPGSYEKGHLPGARKASLRRIIRVNEAGIRDEMLTTDDLAKALSKLGIVTRSRVVMYFADEGAAWAVARYLLTLEYVGMGGRVAYLDGGLPKWLAEERPVSDDIPSYESSEFSVAPVPGVLVDAEWLAERLNDPKIALVDGRPAQGYSGLAGHWDRLGHIPGAKNIPFFSVLTKNPAYLLKSRGELSDMFSEAGAKPGDTVVVYCGTGLWASLPYLAARHLDYDVRLYDGSFQEWSAIKDFPVVTTESSGSAGE